MKLNIVPAKTGVLWVRQGIQTFWRQPIAMSGLFFMFMAVMSIYLFAAGGGQRDRIDAPARCHARPDGRRARGEPG